MEINYKLLLTNEAAYDLEEVIDYYENVREGLGKDFFLSYQKAEELIKSNPKIYACIEGEVRRALTDKFRYSIFYHIIENQQIVEVLAVIHTSRDPKYWKKRIKL
ncbi:MAG: type II toxin-antitoxin system RelE/ParE family toxin [Leptospiraceae bacterium]|nr:type II toxin-antitoxin system RelE/ParE family toxin [Leptospiraceae bacterium]